MRISDEIDALEVMGVPPVTFLCATRLLAATFMAAIVSWIVVATAFGSDIYRSVRNMSSELVMMAVVVAAAFALARYSRDAMARRGEPRR